MNFLLLGGVVCVFSYAWVSLYQAPSSRDRPVHRLSQWSELTCTEQHIIFCKRLRAFPVLYWISGIQTGLAYWLSLVPVMRSEARAVHLTFPFV